jgi:hypothetical protein
MCREPCQRARHSFSALARVAALTARCIYGDAGCTERTTVGKRGASFNRHLDRCGFAPVRCEPCGQSVPRCELKQHAAKQCSKRRVVCK